MLPLNPAKAKALWKPKSSGCKGARPPCNDGREATSPTQAIGFYLRTKDKIETGFVVIKNGKPCFLVEVKAKAKGLSPALYHFQKETKASHAFQVAFYLPFVNNNIYKK